MKIYSPYAEMENAAGMISDSDNARLLIRHSIRFDNPVNNDYDPLLLTPEGIELAKKIGSVIDRPIGECLSSTIKRCVQTARYICEGVDKKYCAEIPEIRETKILADTLGATNANVGWCEYFHYLQIGNKEMCRGVTLEMEIKRLIDTVFLTKGEAGKLDLICTHDSHIIIAASALFDLRTGLDGHDWCRYTEGLFFTGTRNDFTAFWRGEKRRFVDYLI